MKAKKILTILVLTLSFMYFATMVIEAAPMGTAFTYQGRLMDKNKPAEGSYDFQFGLYDGNDPCSATQLGQNDINDVNAIDGHFVVELDFGSDVFDGNAVWLETKVIRSPMGSDPAALRPLMELTPVPYALQTRGIFVDNAGNVGIGTTDPGIAVESELHIVDTSTDQPQLEITAASGKPANIYFSHGSTHYARILFDGPSGSDPGLLAFLFGSGVTNPAVKFGGKVGIGTTDPEYDLDVIGNIRATGAIYGSIDNADKVDNYHAGNSSGQVAVSNSTVCTNLNADQLDGHDAIDFVTPAGMVSNDFGRSGVSSTLYEGTTQLANKYVSINSSQTVGGTKTFSNQTRFTNGILVPDPGPSGNAIHVYNNGSSPTIWAHANQSTNTLHVTNSSDSSPTIWARNQHSDGSNCIYAKNNSDRRPAIYAENSGGEGVSLYGQIGNGNALYAAANGSYPAIYAINDGSGYAGWFSGDLGCSGSKPATVETQSYGHRNLYSDESAEIYFFDRGHGQLANGTCVINLEPIFLETVTINDSYPMLVQITLTADCKGIFVAEKTTSSFIVRELQGGTSDATFDWEVAAKRKGYEDIRMEKIVIFEESKDQRLDTSFESEQQGIGYPGGPVRIIKSN